MPLAALGGLGVAVAVAGYRAHGLPGVDVVQHDMGRGGQRVVEETLLDDFGLFLVFVVDS